MTNHTQKTAVVLCSGGLDSTTCMAMAAHQGFQIVALSFDYGQRHRVELEAARAVAKYYRARKHIITSLGLFREIGGSALTADIEVPQHDNVAQIDDDIPVTYVPARNLVFLSFAAAVAEAHQSDDIFIGVNALDYSGYPDCRPEFISAFATAGRLATKIGVQGGGLRIHTPLMQMTKADIILKGHQLEVPYRLTHSCYAPDEKNLACGQCDSCLLRLKGFKDAGLKDPIEYGRS